MNRRTFITFLFAVVACSALVSAADTLRIVPITHGDEVLVSVDFGDAYTTSVREEISSGLRTTITYEVELRQTGVWVDRTVATSIVSISDQYDNLTRRHSLVRTVDGHVEEALVTEDEAIARRWLTSLSRLLLCRTSKLEPSRDYYVRIRARIRPNRGSLFGAASAVIGQAKFTFIP